MRHLGQDGRAHLCSPCTPSHRGASPRPFRGRFFERARMLVRRRIASGPLSKIAVFPAVRASFRFVRSSESDYSMPRSVFDRRIAPKTLAKPRFSRISRSIDFEPRANDSLNDTAAFSRRPRHPSTFDRRSRPLFGKSSLFLDKSPTFASRFHFRRRFIDAAMPFLRSRSPEFAFSLGFRW